jgi:very-short-patch-repair endonuclease
MSLAQLRAAGLSEKAIRHRVRRGHMARVHPGVYRVGPVPSPLAEPFAAVLACGPTAVLSHHAAAVLHGITKHARRIDVTVTTGHPRPKGVTVHRAKVDDEERTERHGIAITTAARTIVDLATHISRRDLDRAVEQAVVLCLETHDSLADAVRCGRRPGTKVLRDVLADLGDPSLTRSEAERRLIELIRSAQLPAPVTNTRIGRYEVDLVWPRAKLVVEVDGYAFHSTRQAFERDRARDAALLLGGHRVVRITWRQIVREPHAVVATLATALGSAQAA